MDGAHEKEFTLQLGLAVREALTKFACSVLMTRETDTGLASAGALGAELRARATVANQTGADLLVSLHHDSTGGAAARGGSIWVWTDKPGWLQAEANHKAPNSYALATKIAPVVEDALAEAGIPWRGVMCSDFGVLRETAKAGVLIECFFGSNAEDVAAARQPGFVFKLAEAIAVAVAGALEIAPVPVVAPAWDPGAELARLKERGIISSDHQPDSPVTWGELATVLNRVLDKKPD